MRKPGLVFTFERTKCQLLPSLCLSLSSVKHLSATFPKLVTVIYLFSSSLWKLLIKSSLRRKLCHYLDSSDFLFFFLYLLKAMDAWKKVVREGWRSQIFLWWCTEVLCSVISSSLLCHSPCRPDLLLGWVLWDGWREETSLSPKRQRWWFPSV